MAQWWSALLTPQAECSAPPEREARSRTRAISRAVAGSHRPRRALGCGRAVVVISGLLSAHGNHPARDRDAVLPALLQPMPLSGARSCIRVRHREIVDVRIMLPAHFHFADQVWSFVRHIPPLRRIGKRIK